MMRRISRVGIRQSRSPGWKHPKLFCGLCSNEQVGIKQSRMPGWKRSTNTSEPDSVYVGIHQSRSPGWKPKDEDPSGQITLGRN